MICIAIRVMENIYTYTIQPNSIFNEEKNAVLGSTIKIWMRLKQVCQGLLRVAQHTEDMEPKSRPIFKTINDCNKDTIPPEAMAKRQ